jgi:hypothetical protein
MLKQFRPYRPHVAILAVAGGFAKYNITVRRAWEHKEKAVPGFSAKYSVDCLVWFERYDTLEAAMQRERPDQRLEAQLEN